MKLYENIQRIKSMMGVINENKVGDIIQDMGVYDAIRYFGGYDNLTKMMGDYELSKEDKIIFIKEVVTKLCEQYDDVEVGSFNLKGSQIEYDETDNENQVIEYYRPKSIIVERYTKEEDDVDYEYDDFYLGGFEVTYEELTHSLIDEIFYLMIDQI
jgi:hypothetical protein